jgi:hypothetical protein
MLEFWYHYRWMFFLRGWRAGSSLGDGSHPQCFNPATRIYKIDSLNPASGRRIRN